MLTGFILGLIVATIVMSLKVLLANFVRVGITTQVEEDGKFKNNSQLLLGHNYCPECGTKYSKKIKENEQLELDI